MKMLKGTSSGIIHKPYLMTIFGVESIGKTTFGAGAKDPIILGPESGSSNLNVMRFNDVNSLEDVHRDLDQLLTISHDRKTLVIDSLDWIEPLVFEFIKKKFKVDQVEEAGGGYGKYVTIVLGEWKLLILKLNKLRDDKKMNI